MKGVSGAESSSEDISGGEYVMKLMKRADAKAGIDAVENIIAEQEGWAEPEAKIQPRSGIGAKGSH